MKVVLDDADENWLNTVRRRRFEQSGAMREPQIVGVATAYAAGKLSHESAMRMLRDLGLSSEEAAYVLPAERRRTDANQPRVPAGSKQGGQFSSKGSSGSGGLADAMLGALGRTVPRPPSKPARARKAAPKKPESGDVSPIAAADGSVKRLPDEVIRANTPQAIADALPRATSDSGAVYDRVWIDDYKTATGATSAQMLEQMRAGQIRMVRLDLVPAFQKSRNKIASSEIEFNSATFHFIPVSGETPKPLRRR